MLRKIVTFIVALALVCQAPIAAATDLGTAFTGLLGNGAAVSVTAPGRYQSSARNSFVAGGFDVRVPKSTGTDAQLFSFTPPRLSVGCNGVSAYFGGFSFINGAEFDQLVKSIASGAALGFVTMIVMKGLCPQCEDIVTKLKNALQQASKLAIDSCKLGEQAAAHFSGDIADFTQSMCGSTSADNGGSSDFLSGISDTCTSIANNIKGIKSVNGTSSSSDPQNKAIDCKTASGNLTWQALDGDQEGFAGTAGADNYGQKILLMNMMGATLRTGDVESSCPNVQGTQVSTSAANPQIFCQPQVTAKDIAGAFMCGTDSTALNAMGPAAKDYCQTFFNPSNQSTADGTASFSGVTSSNVLVCDDGGKTGCKVLDSVPWASANIVTGTGFLPAVNKILNDAVTAVRQNTALSPDALALMSIAPYPIYQAVNAAAVYPAAASDLLDSISILVAESVVAKMMEGYLSPAGRNNPSICASQDQIHRVIDTLATAKAENEHRRQLMAQNIAVQEGIKEQIRSINIAIQKQVMSPDLLNQNRMAASLMNSITNNKAGGTPDSSGSTVSTQP